MNARREVNKKRGKGMIVNRRGRRRVGAAAAFFVIAILAASLSACGKPAGEAGREAGPAATAGGIGATAQPEQPDAAAASAGAAGQPEQPPAALALELRPVWPTVYAGGPFAIRGLITSPRAQQDAYLELRAIEDGTKSKASSFEPPAIAPAWAEQVAFTVKQVQPDGSVKPVLEDLDWKAGLVPLSEDQTPSPAGLLPGLREWMVGPEAAAPLVEGAYLLQASWKGPEGTLNAPEARFTFKPAATRDEKTEHARRLARFEFGRGRYQEALAQATAVIDADPVFTPEIAETFMVAAASQAGLKNWRAAAETYKRLLAWLPARSDQADLVRDMIKYVEEQAASPSR